MAKQQPRRPTPAPAQPAKRPTPAPAAPRREERRQNIFRTGDHEILYTRENFIYFGIGLLLVLVGLIAMTGGAQTNPQEWHGEEVYSFRRITLAPVLMVAGFVVVTIGIFKRPKSADDNTPSLYNNPTEEE
ncbi:MAG: DUF3098 domain-containing protein [Saprospiraceae bacterium]|nr:DUF3098 domain-containing protein [Saprospiraceae bacterium]HNL38659.1 DUF3098 domain-containing protein [Saprospiraceae bacterium]